MNHLVTPRLTLTPVSVDDFQDLTDLWQHPDFTRYITGRALSEEEVWFRLLRDLGHWQAKGYGNWTIRLTDSGAYAGSVGFFDYRRELSPPFESPEVGWGISPAFQNQGIAREALDSALTWADSHLPGRIVCMISPENAASIHLASRAGFATYAEGTYKGSGVTLYERYSRG